MRIKNDLAYIGGWTIIGIFAILFLIELLILKLIGCGIELFCSIKRRINDKQ